MKNINNKANDKNDDIIEGNKTQNCCCSSNNQDNFEYEAQGEPTVESCCSSNSVEESKENNEYKITVSENGHFTLSDELIKMLGVEEDSPVRVIKQGDRLEIYPNIHSLGKVYIEATALCNLTCQTCVRNSWSEKMGNMDINTFDMLVEQLKEFKALQTVMFGGFGEPTFNKNILYMIDRVKALGVKAEMVTNGTLMNKDMVEALLEKALDTLWVSFDGTSAKYFDDIRAGASFDSVVENLKLLKRLNSRSKHKIKVGIAFVVMKRNLSELKNLSDLAVHVGAKMISVSNVLPYCSEVLDQMLCEGIIYGSHRSEKFTSIPISLPLIDGDKILNESFSGFLEHNFNISIMRNKIIPDTPSCRFIKERCTFVRWDGQVSPCMGLLHSYNSYFTSDRSTREVTSYSLGSISEKTLKDIWNSQEYHDFREKVDSFNFSPCVRCGPCSLASKNHEDCFGNDFPTCGGCLWAQGVIQCP